MANANGGKMGQMVRSASAAISPDQLVSEIRKRAQEIFEQRGAASGTDTGDWLRAEAEVKSRYGIAR